MEEGVDEDDKSWRGGIMSALELNNLDSFALGKDAA